MRHICDLIVRFFSCSLWVYGVREMVMCVMCIYVSVIICVPKSPQSTENCCFVPWIWRHIQPIRSSNASTLLQLHALTFHKNGFMKIHKFFQGKQIWSATLAATTAKMPSDKRSNKLWSTKNDALCKLIMHIFFVIERAKSCNCSGKIVYTIPWHHVKYTHYHRRCCRYSATKVYLIFTHMISGSIANRKWHTINH